ncbi:hypothetical protein EMIHUDRAFT_195785 [Emiliania huxleyi CCMP1516]|uniref:Uncharacterized protein n=2 Tax=Emiliania huxleyi TaxID=2903 RepID=A0A0D3JI24_EMIH1|nr:hypothetical protein EMIHUDRAFT_195785 [Emiliania huxleyi CCMP1516]EOD23159.1 hypothetical protein EMIHUDRAFT_195785 [Emiliania huxleyi CCMP1516]|eukprot:XP_005775588.1 hypothetical protein EMIHUDRAFT_195785 [Emiliania huxleyi CCMP1516]
MAKTVLTEERLATALFLARVDDGGHEKLLRRGAPRHSKCKAQCAWVATQPPALDVPEPELQELCIGSILEIGHLLVASLAQHLWQRPASGAALPSCSTAALPACSTAASERKRMMSSS